MKATDTHAASRATRRAIGSLVVALTWLCGETAHAYDADYFTYRSDSLMHQQMLRNMARSVDRSRQLAHKGQGASAAPGSASTVIPLGTTPSLPARVAAKYPEKERAAVQHHLGSLIANYAKLERHFGIPHGDLAGCVAAYIVGSYMAYRNTDVSDGDFSNLVGQIRDTIRAAPQFQKASVAEKREMYEQLAVLSVTMIQAHDSLQHSPEASKRAELQRTGKSALENFLKVDASRIRLDHMGLRLQ